MAENEQDVAGIIRGFLVESLGDTQLEPDHDIFAIGYVNSLFALELVTFVERRFGLAVETDDLDLDNFRSIERMANFVLRKRGATQARPEAEGAAQ